MLQGLNDDLRYAARRLARAPAFVALAASTMALGLGANVGLFAAIRAVLLQPLPFPEPDRLVRVWSTSPSEGWRRGGASLQDFSDWRGRGRSFAALAAFNERSGSLLAGKDPQSVDFALASATFFDVVATAPAFGRAFSTAEDQPGHGPVVVISHRLWQRAFGGDSEVLGRTLTLEGQPLVVVGVMPAGFHFPGPTTDLWRPFAMGRDDAGPRGGRWLDVIGRLAPGASRARAQAEMSAVASSLAREYPESNEGIGVFVEPLLDAAVVGIRPTLLLLWGAVGLVLLLACANTAGLLLARSTARRPELAIRMALGAGPRRILRQVVAESVLVSLAAAVLGLPLAYAVTATLRSLGPSALPRADEIALEPVTLAFGLGLALVTGVVFGLLPALHAALARPQATLREGGPRSTGGGARSARVLAAAQVGLALVLVVGAGLLLRSLAGLLSVDRGFAVEGVLTARVEPPMDVHPEGEGESAFLAAFVHDRSRAARFYDQLVEGIETLPGVRAAAINRMPLSGNWWSTAISVEGRPAREGSASAPVLARIVTPGYFETLEIPLRRGRGFSPADGERSPLVAVVSESLAHAYWPFGDPLGERIALDTDPPPGAPRYIVVGIAADVRQSALSEEPPPVVYTLVSQSFFGFFGNWGMDLVIRAPGSVAVLPALRERLRSLDPALPLASVRPMAEVVREDTARTRTASLLLGAFAAVALVLAAVGIFGVWSASVSRRTREFGVRMALGARPAQVLEMVLREALLTAALGSALGVLAAVGLTRLAQSLLFGVSPLDPLTYLATAGVLALTALVAGAVPAVRAARVNPTGALRAE